MTTYLYGDIKQTAQQYKEIINQPIFTLIDAHYPKHADMLKLWCGRKGIQVREEQIPVLVQKLLSIYFQSSVYSQILLRNFNDVTAFVNYVEAHPKTPSKESDMEYIGQLYATASAAIPTIQQLEQQVELYVVTKLQTLP